MHFPGKGKKKSPDQQDVQQHVVSPGARALNSPNTGLENLQRVGSNLQRVSSNMTVPTFSQQDRNAFLASTAWSLMDISQNSSMKVQHAENNFIIGRAKVCFICDRDEMKCASYRSETP